MYSFNLFERSGMGLNFEPYCYYSVLNGRSWQIIPSMFGLYVLCFLYFIKFTCLLGHKRSYFRIIFLHIVKKFKPNLLMDPLKNIFVNHSILNCWFGYIFCLDFVKISVEKIVIYSWVKCYIYLKIWIYLCHRYTIWVHRTYWPGRQTQ